MLIYGDKKGQIMYRYGKKTILTAICDVFKLKDYKNNKKDKIFR